MDINNINFKITKDGYADYTSLTTAGIIKGISLRNELNSFELDIYLIRKYGVHLVIL